MSDDQTTRTTEGQIITQEGTIPSSDFNFSSDSDAMYRPMLAGIISTRCMGDCGKADDNLEG